MTDVTPRFKTPKKPKRQRFGLPPVGAKAIRERGPWEACRAAVIERSGGACEAPEVYQVDATAFASVPHPPGPHRGAHVHHVWPEDRDAGRHEPGRCLHLCFDAHAWAHANHDKAALAGLLRPDKAAR